MAKDKDPVTLHALQIAKSKFGWDQVDFGEQIGESKQTVTNWLKRGMATRAHAKVARKLQISVEELVAGTSMAAPKIAEQMVIAYNAALSEDALLFAAEWAKLPKSLRAQISALVHVMAGELGRNSQMKPGRPPAEDR